MHSADKMWFTYGDQTYEWVGALGDILCSYERGVKQGEVRLIGDQPFYAIHIYSRGFKKPKVCWTVQNANMDQIRLIRRSIFGCYPIGTPCDVRNKESQ